jgi:glutamine amidotransferase
MCRWLAYTGSPVLVEDLLYKPTNSLIVQSLHSRLGAEATNGDGFGLGWYDEHSPTPGVFRSIEPAWSDRNLQELSAHVRSGVVLAHIRATSGSAVQQTNCHPFRRGRWLWMHNGLLAGFSSYKREMAMAVDPALFPLIEGSTDSELLFYLALTFGLEDDPPTAVARAVGFVEEVAGRHDVAFPVQMTVATTDGTRLWAFRYSTEGQSRSLFRNADVAVLREQYPENPLLHGLADTTRIVVSEPLGDLKGAWHEVPESSCLVIDGGQEELRPFVPA